MSVRNSDRQLQWRARSGPGSAGRVADRVANAPAEDRVGSLEDSIVDDKVVGRELGGELLQAEEKGVSEAVSAKRRGETRAHVDEVLPLVGEVGVCHDGNGLANLDLEGLLAREADHDGDDALLERLGRARRQRGWRVLELRAEVSCVNLACSNRAARAS